MQQGMTETIKSAIEALKANPLLLVVILLNVLFIGSALLYLRHEQAQMDTVLKACLERGT